MYEKLPFEKVNNDIIHYMRLNRFETLDSLLKEYILEQKPNKEFLRGFEIYRSEFEFWDYLRDYEMQLKYDTPEVNDTGMITSQQVLLMHYIFEGLEVPQKRTISAKVRLTKALTNKNYDRIKEIMENPLSAKRLKGQYQDLEAVRVFFVDLKMEKIVRRINMDLNSIMDEENEINI